MNDRFSAKLRMYIQLLAVCDMYKSVWQANPAFSRGVEKLRNAVAGINELNKGLQGTTSGATETKTSSKEKMIEMAIRFSGALQALAYEKGLKELENNATVDCSDFRLIKETDADDLALHIHTLAVLHLADLEQYGINAKEGDDFAALIEDFSNRIGQPRTIVTLAKGTRISQQSYFITADESVQKLMDNLIVQYRSGNKAFYEDYQSARSVIRLGAKAADKVQAVN